MTSMIILCYAPARRRVVLETFESRRLLFLRYLQEELYDYAKDPDETVNVAANSDYADALQQMKRYWEEYKKTRIVRNEK